LTSIAGSLRSRARAIGLAGAVVWTFLALAAVLVLVSQPYFVGFPAGHHGWVSSHYLSILSHTTPETGLVGYTVGVIEPDGKAEFVYWNRYPALGAVLHRALTLEFTDNLAETIHISRQFMNLVFILNLCLSDLVLNGI
jgi:hypothetical protein